MTRRSRTTSTTIIALLAATAAGCTGSSGPTAATNSASSVTLVGFDGFEAPPRPLEDYDRPLVRSTLRESALEVVEAAAFSESSLLRANAIESLQVVPNRILPHINKGSPIIVLSCLEDDSTIVNAIRDLRARDFDVTILTPSSLEFEFDARRLDRTGYEVLKTERDILISELRGLGAFVMDWEPDMLLSTALAGARGF